MRASGSIDLSELLDDEEGEGNLENSAGPLEEGVNVKVRERTAAVQAHSHTPPCDVPGQSGQERHGAYGSQGLTTEQLQLQQQLYRFQEEARARDSVARALARHPPACGRKSFGVSPTALVLGARATEGWDNVDAAAAVDCEPPSFTSGARSAVDECSSSSRNSTRSTGRREILSGVPIGGGGDTRGHTSCGHIDGQTKRRGRSGIIGGRTGNIGGGGGSSIPQSSIHAVGTEGPTHAHRTVDEAALEGGVMLPDGGWDGRSGDDDSGYFDV
jgi:hypothetical protein